MTADGAALAAQIAADPGDDNAYLVYADWLQSQNDPLGELIIFDHRLANGEDVRRERWAHLDKHRNYLLGAMGHRVDLFERSPRKFGFLRALPRDDKLASWLEAPVARFVTSIAAEHDAITALEISSARPPLRSLAIQTHHSTTRDLTWVWSRFPDLEHFELDGGAVLDGIDLPAARELRVRGLDDAAVRCVVGAQWPALEMLRIGCYADEDALAPLLAKPLPRLQHLSLERIHMELRKLVAVIADAPIVSQLRYLEIIGPIQGPGMTALAKAADRFRHLEVCDIRLGKQVRTKDRPVIRSLIKPDPARNYARPFAG